MPILTPIHRTGRPKIVADKVRKSFIHPQDAREVVAIDDISVSIGDREFLAIIGPSGCGKSTFLYCVAGFEKITSGSLTLDGTPVNGPGADRGIVFQEFVLFPWRTVLRNITMGLEIRKLPRREAIERARHWISLTGLSGFEDAYPATLSGGMKQRVAIARALAYDPDVLLLDEPFGALDVQTKSYMIRDLQKVWLEADKTMLMVTHSVTEAVLMADRVIVLSARPSRVIYDKRIEAGHPRSELDPAMIEFRREITEALSAEVDRAMAFERSRAAASPGA